MTDENETEYTCFLVHVTTPNGIENEKFFVGRLPKIGEAVEFVYVGESRNGGMRLQLRVREP